MHAQPGGTGEGSALGSPGRRRGRLDPRAAALGALVVLTGAGLLALAAADNAISLEYRVKAAYLYNFARFIEWPPEAFSGPEEPIVIGVLGRDPFGPILDETLAGKTIDGRPLAVARAAAAGELQGCHVVFVGDLEDRSALEILDGFKQSFAVTVGETGDFLAAGGVINLVIQDRKVRFEINMDAADRARVKISSKLLKLATAVRSEPERADR